ncbi:hypothetical protein BC940DRAFT_307744 [Gongronella butleri]|nr:hypothetical protein BC940DRAFT_307744 [Gongronella butleri]
MDATYCPSFFFSLVLLAHCLIPIHLGSFPHLIYVYIVSYASFFKVYIPVHPPLFISRCLALLFPFFFFTYFLKITPWRTTIQSIPFNVMKEAFLKKKSNKN